MIHPSFAIPTAYGLGKCNVLIFDLGGGTLIATALPYGLGERNPSLMVLAKHNVLIFNLGGGTLIAAVIPYSLDKKAVIFEEDPSMCSPHAQGGINDHPQQSGYLPPPLAALRAVVLPCNITIAILRMAAALAHNSAVPPLPALLQAAQLVHAPLLSTLVVTAVLLPPHSSTMVPPPPPSTQSSPQFNYGAPAPPSTQSSPQFSYTHPPPHNRHELVVQPDFVL
ncbi:uncharacterized protein EDB91DRAFT_1249981 [Suillus paluster]|uniref:uncharacterized protein n=1 Tax=Suillus paluster TaxID=48578 RepID=UPI001B876858|nr:uncharacterized protein EDB91DRAFT_1249981 [Suillus paluster]KAG1736673.1 hypothetical protein EDB91DRAFT_1249981 [Suillus paluster]